MRRLMLSEEEEMKNWELIADITIGETTQNISITQDINGNPFKLEKVEIFVLSMPSESTTTMTIAACATANRIDPTTIGQAGLSTDTKRYCYGLWEKTGMGIINKKTLWSVNGTNAFSVMQTSLTANQSFIDDGASAPDICEGVWIGSHYQDVLSPGTRIKIFGVRE